MSVSLLNYQNILNTRNMRQRAFITPNLICFYLAQNSEEIQTCCNIFLFSWIFSKFRIHLIGLLFCLDFMSFCLKLFAAAIEIPPQQLPAILFSFSGINIYINYGAKIFGIRKQEIKYSSILEEAHCYSSASVDTKLKLNTCINPNMSQMSHNMWGYLYTQTCVWWIFYNIYIKTSYF